MRKYSEYLKEGFELANNNLHIVAVIIAIIVLSVIISLLQQLSYSAFLALLSIVLLLVTFSCNFTLPLVFRHSETKSKMTLREFLEETFATSKRLLLPLIGIGILLILLLFVFLVILAVFHLFSLGALKIWQVRSQTNLLWYAMTSLIAVIPASLLIFTSQIFALEKKGLIASIKKSLSLSLKNPQLLLLVCIYIWVLTFFSFPLLHILPVITLIIVVIQQYFHVALYAVVYRFYTKRVHNE